MDGDEQSAVVLSQEGLAFKTGTPYQLSFVAESDVNNTIVANVGGHTFTAKLKAGEKKQLTFTLPADAEYLNQDISFTFGTEGTTYLDNVALVENAMIKNGSFNDGLTGFEPYVDSSAKASYVVDSLKDDNALAVTVDNTGDQDWKIQIKQNNVNLEEGKEYKLTFKAKSSLDRKIRVIMQGDESHGWAVYSNDNIVSLTDEWQ
ncbi:MAG: carbohydrate binding domain-containing protein, partial [Erysipelotrichaceae bacterium]|nr:carbohydrate binding domain-containing protein [Erysipelotrichaceae bacterium]